MSSYNQLVMPDEEICPNCGSRIVRKVQFKYGEVWQHKYRMGEKIRWGANDIGKSGHSRVVVSAHPEPCPACGDVPDTRDEISIENDVIVRVEQVPVDKEYQRSGHEPFLVLEE